MKALRVLKENRLDLVRSESLALAPWQARISVAISLVCGSDIKNIRTSSSAGRIPGHEFSGVVAEVSSQARGLLSVGDRVTAFPMMPCHTCLNCKKSNFRDCNYKEPLGGDVWPGSFSSELIIDARMAVLLSPKLSMEQGALLEHLCCAYRFAKEVSEIGTSVDAHILIVGDGPIALGNLQMLLLEGYKNITVLGKHSLRLRHANELGALNVRNISQFVENDFVELEKIDICVLSAPSEQVMLGLSAALNDGASIIEQTRFLDDDLKQVLVSRGFVFRRAFAYHLSDFESVAQLIISGSIKTDHLVTTRLSMEDFGFGYPDILAKHKNIKIAIISDQALFDSRNKG